MTDLARELRDEYPPVDVTTVVFSRDFAGIGCCVIPQERVLEIASKIEAMSDLLRIIARGVEIGQSGNMNTLRRTGMMNLARDYCDANGLSYATTDLRVVELVGFLKVGETT